MSENLSPKDIRQPRREEDAQELQALGQLIGQRRKSANLSQQELGDRAGLQRTYVADVERGARNVCIINVIKIAKALGLTVSDLCEGLGCTTCAPSAKSSSTPAVGSSGP